jgi:DUF971 family protein
MLPPSRCHARFSRLGGNFAFVRCTMSLETTVTKLDLKKTQGLTVTFGDGKVSTFSLSMLRSKCPCASCKSQRSQQAAKPSRLTILPGNYAQELIVEHAELVGNYALRIDWSDGHATGIYSFEFLREIAD